MPVVRVEPQALTRLEFPCCVLIAATLFTSLVGIHNGTVSENLEQQVRGRLRGGLTKLPAVYGRQGNADDGPRKMWAAEWQLIQQYAPADGAVHDGIKLVDPPANSRDEVANFPAEVINDACRRMRDLHGYDRVTRAREQHAREARQLEYRRERRRLMRAAEGQRMRDALLVGQRRRELTPRASTLDDLLHSDAEYSDPDEWVGGDGWPMEDCAGETVPGAKNGKLDGMVTDNEEEEEVQPVSADPRN